MGWWEDVDAEIQFGRPPGDYDWSTYAANAPEPPPANPGEKPPPPGTPPPPPAGPVGKLVPSNEAPGSASGAGSQRWTKETFIALFGIPNTLDELLSMKDKIESMGGKVNKNASGAWNGKITTPDGRIVDVMLAAGEGGKGFIWDEGGGSGDGAGGGTLLDPFTKQFEYPSFEPPDPFKAPTAEEAFADQGFQFALKQGQEALQKSGAAKGTLLTTGLLKDLDQFSQDAASQQYGNVYNRRFGEHVQAGGDARNDWATDYKKALGEFGLGYDIWAANQDRPFNKLSTLAGMGQVSTNSLMGAAGQYAGNFGNTLGNSNLSNLFLQQGNINAANQGGGGANWMRSLMNNPAWYGYGR